MMSKNVFKKMSNIRTRTVFHHLSKVRFSYCTYSYPLSVLVVLKHIKEGRKEDLSCYRNSGGAAD